MTDGITASELAERAGVEPELIDRLVGLGIVSPDEGAFRPADVYRVRLLQACERVGLPAEAVARAVAEGRLSLSFMDLPHYRWAALGRTTYRELAAEVALPLDLVLDVLRALGYARPGPEDRAREDDPGVFRLIGLSATWLDHDAIVRTSRVFTDAIRRIAEAEGALFDTYIVGGLQRQGLGLGEAVDAANRFGAEVTPLQEQLLLTLYRRQQERRWTEYTVEGIERVLEEMGLSERQERPPAMGFVDLAGYTRLTEEQGDEAGVRLATELARMVDAVVGGRGGQPVKWLGDGVMMYFRDPAEAVRATLELVRRAPGIGLPAHAGVAAGPVVIQDGDYFGRTVNLAARIAERAAPGQTLVTAEISELADGIGFRAVGSLELKGFARPVELFEALPTG